MGEFIRDRLPDAESFFEAEGVPLIGRGKWRYGPCHFHDGSDSFRVNVESGGWRCMNCGEKGGDVLSYAMQRHGLGFVQAAQALGCWVEDGKPYTGPTKPPGLPARDALQLGAREMLVAFVVMADVRCGHKPSDTDWSRFIEATRRVGQLAEDYA